ncbi:MAG: sigma-70 family RNA polymerase sigma factor [Myxococcota bacterium]
MGAVHSLAQHRATLAVEPSDAELIRAILERRDAHAKQAFYFRFAPMVTRMAHRLLGGHEVDDVVQDVFLAVFSKLGTLRDPAGAKGWIRSITLNLVRRRIRRRSLRRRLGFRGDALDPERLVGLADNPEVTAELRELYRILEEMPVDVRLAIVLRRVEGMTFPEIAAAMGKSLSTVKRRVAEGETQLTHALESRGAQ